MKTMHFSLKLLIAILALGSLTGCNPFWGLAPSSSKLQDQGWAWTEEKPSPSSIVCYNTLGQAQCQVVPTINQLDEERRIG